MNTNKRLLSVLVCIAMILSMFSSFAYAAGSGEIDAQSTETTSVVNETGANPTTDVAAPTIDANTVVIDSTVTAETTGYVLTWEGKEYSTYDVDGVATDMFVYGTNLFASIEAAQAVAPVGATYLVKSVAYTVDFGGSAEKETFSKAGNWYTEAYNTMPYTVGTAFDGSDWALNEEYTAKSVKINGVEIAITDSANSGDVNLYGFTVSYGSYAFDLNATTVAVNVNVQNTYYLPTASDASTWFSMGTFAKTDAAATSDIQFKNFYLGASSGRFTSEYVPNNFTFDGLYIPADVDMGGTPYLKQGYNSKESHIVFKNWNIQNEDLTIYFQGNNTKNYCNSASDTNISGASGNKDFRTVTVENCTLNNSSLHNLTSRFIAMYANSISMWTVKGNRLINTTGTDANLFVNNSTTWGNYLSIDCQNNYFQGYVANDGFASNNGNSTLGITIKNNYLANSTSEIGTDLYIKSTNASNDWHSSDWYLDPAMSVKASSLAEGITVTNGVLMQDGLNITAYVPSGTGTESVVLPDGVTAEYDLTNGTVAITKTVNEVTYTVDYDIEIVELAAPLFTVAYDDPADMIDASKAILITNAFASAGDNTVQTSAWADETEYSFIKGVNLFDTIEEASAYTLANNITDAHYLILDLNGSKGDSAPSQQFTMPGKYFTRNYNKNPYTKSDATLDPYGLNWASNINTDAADSFVTANGISVKYFNLSRMAMAGDVEFYGFRITYTVEMNTSSAGTRSADSDMNVKFVNTYADISSSELIYRDTVLNTAEVAEEYDDSLTFENLYYNPSTTASFFKTDCWPVRDITFDGVFMDEEGAELSPSYLHTYTSDYSFTLKNSNFRNVTMPLYLRGHYGKSTDTKLNRSLEFDNNIFYNASLFAEDTFLAVYTGYYNKFTFTNNTVYTQQDGVYLRTTDHSGGDTHPDITVTVKDNVLNGFANEFDIARWISASASEVSYNWVSPTRDDPADGVTASGVTYTMINTSTQEESGYEYSTDYYIDSAKTMLASEFIKKFEFTMLGGGVYKDGTSLDLYISTGSSAADLALKDANASIVGWKTADGTAADASAITKDAVGEGTEYTVTVGYPINGVVYTMDFAVTALPNTVTGYAASTYDESYVATHPTEKTTLEDIAHFPSGFEDPAKLITGENAAFIDSDSGYGSTKYTIATGDYKVMTWNGTQYLTVMNKTLFATVDNAYSTLTAAGIAQPEYLIAGPEWGSKHGGYYGGTTSDYIIRSPGKYFMPNYATAPYIKGDSKGEGWVSNIGTGEGQFNPDNSIKAGYITIMGTATDVSKAGTYELYGYTIASRIKDNRTVTANQIDLKFYNCYFESTGYVYDSILGGISAATTNGTNRDSLTIKDSYILVTEGRSFLRNQGWANMTFDGVFADFTNQTYSGTRYFQQVYNDFKLEIKNSFFTGRIGANTYFEGYNNLGSGSVTEGNKQFILENNIFKNYSFYGTSQFLTMKHQYFTEITIKNNYVDNSGNTMYLFSESNLDSNAGKDASAKYTITENTFIGFNGALSYDATIGRVLTDGSVASKNYTSTDAALEGVQLTADALTGDYYLDPAREILASEYIVKEWTADKAYIEVDNENLTVSYKISAGGALGTTGLVLGNELMTAKIYADAELTTELTDLASVTSDVYLVIDAVNSEGFDLTDKVYTVDIEMISDKFFKDVYVVPSTDTVKTTIDKTKAILVDYASKDTADGAIYTATWQGVEYDFIKGETVFETLDALNAYLDTASIEYPHVLMKTVSDGTYSGEEEGKQDYSDIKAYGEKAKRLLIIKHHGAYYTENYNIKPYTVTDGVWAKNPDYVLENGIVGRWIKNDSQLGTGTYELYGFAAVSAFQIFSESNEGRTDEIPNMYVENGYIIGDNVSITPSEAPAHAHCDYTYVKDNAAAGEVHLKNVYVDSSITPHTLIYSGAQASKMTYEGVFVDGGNYTDETQGDTNIYITGYELNIIDSYIKDSKGNSNIRVAATPNAENSFAINIQNTVFDNATLGGDALIAFNDGITSFTFENNTVISDEDIEFIQYNDSDTHNATLDLTVKNNVLAGVNGAINAGDNVNIVEIADNDFAGSWNTEGTEVGDRITVAGTDYANADYWLVYNGEEFSKISNVRYDMTFTYGDTTYNQGEEVVVNIKATEPGANVIDLYELLSEEQYNTVAFYADEDCLSPFADASAIEIKGETTVYVYSASHDKTSIGTDGGEAVWALTFNANSAVTVTNTGMGSVAVMPGANGENLEQSKTHVYLRWKATVEGAQLSFVPSEDVTEHRVGAIYAPTSCADHIDSAKAQLQAYVDALNANTDTFDGFNAALESANSALTADSKSVAIYTLDENNIPTWDTATASYNYYLTAKNKLGKERSAVMYAIYFDSAESLYKIAYSDIVSQTAGA